LSWAHWWTNFDRNFGTYLITEAFQKFYDLLIDHLRAFESQTMTCVLNDYQLGVGYFSVKEMGEAGWGPTVFFTYHY
jgi:hypothetical protein